MKAIFLATWPLQAIWFDCKPQQSLTLPKQLYTVTLLKQLYGLLTNIECCWSYCDLVHIKNTINFQVISGLHKGYKLESISKVFFAKCVSINQTRLPLMLCLYLSVISFLQNYLGCSKLEHSSSFLHNGEFSVIHKPFHSIKKLFHWMYKQLEYTAHVYNDLASVDEPGDAFLFLIQNLNIFIHQIPFSSYSYTAYC